MLSGSTPGSTRYQREQLLPAAAGDGMEMRVDGHQATVTLGKTGVRYVLRAPRRRDLLGGRLAARQTTHGTPAAPAVLSGRGLAATGHGYRATAPHAAWNTWAVALIRPPLAVNAAGASSSGTAASPVCGAKMVGQRKWWVGRILATPGGRLGVGAHPAA